MRLGENNRDLTELEKKAGQKAARALGRELRNILGSLTTRQTGQLLKASTASAVMKFDSLDHIAVRSTDYSFKLHHGFEGIKSNGVRMRLKSTNHFGVLLNNSKTLDRLADEVGEIRAEEVTAKINW